MKVFYEHSKVSSIVEFFCKYVLYIDFSRYFEEPYLIEVNELPDAVFIETVVLHTLWFEVYLPIHAGMVVIVAFWWNIEVDVG